MKYKGYFGEITYDDAKIFHGEIIGLKDVITFQGKSVNELKKAFQDSINDYLAWCTERGETPEFHAISALMLSMSTNIKLKK